MALLFPVILGSVRRDRQGIKAARYIIDELGARGEKPVLVDPCEKELPLIVLIHPPIYAPASTASSNATPDTIDRSSGGAYNE